MSQELEERLRKTGAKKGLSGERLERYVMNHPLMQEYLQRKKEKPDKRMGLLG